MIIPKFWGHANVDVTTPDGRVVPVGKWHWSNLSIADAQEKARERLQSIASRVAAGEPFPARYAYASDQPLREEVIEQVEVDGAPGFVITRNAYGALVLNTEDVMFVDIDFPEEEYVQPPQPSPQIDVVSIAKSWLGKLLAGGVETVSPLPPAPAPARAKASPIDDAVRKVETWVAQNPAWGFRLYRTFSGLRLIATNGLFTPDDAENLSHMQDLGCDALYLKLCKSQKSFRARLTPKPWRIGWHPPFVKFPFVAPHQQSAIERWVAEYEKRAQDFATCKFLKQVGVSQQDSRIAAVVAKHDDITRANRDLPLA